VSRRDGNSCLGNRQKKRATENEQQKMGIYMDMPIFGDTFLDAVMPLPFVP